MNKKVIFGAAFTFIGYLEIKKYKKDKKKREQQNEILKKDNIIMETLVQWVQIEHENKNLSLLLREMNYKSVGIYGYGYLGKQLERVLSDSLVEITCVIDKSVKYRRNGELILHPHDSLPDMDVIIVTSPYYFTEIKEELEKSKVFADIISLDALLYQL